MTRFLNSGHPGMKCRNPGKGRPRLVYAVPFWNRRGGAKANFDYLVLLRFNGHG